MREGGGRVMEGEGGGEGEGRGRVRSSRSGAVFHHTMYGQHDKSGSQDCVI